ncbi:MAG: pitrilysin family protein [Zavarzinella sp.]
MPFQQHRLANGITLLGENHPSALSVSMSFWVKTGARDESPDVSGVSHFLEHMVFKGTETRDSFAVNRDFSRIGADNNAWTSEENTVFYGVVLPEYLPQLADVLCDMMRPTLREEDFLTEKEVILDEIARYEVQPGWVLFDNVRPHHYGAHPLSQSVLGTTESIKQLTCEQMRNYFNSRYVGSNILVAVTGQFDWDVLREMVEAKCGHWPAGTAPRTQVVEVAGPGTIKVVQVPVEKAAQEYVALTSQSPTANSELSYAAALVATAIGDYTGSRYYWALSDTGLADDVGMSVDESDGTSAVMSTFSCEPENVAEVYATCRQILDAVQKDGLTSQEIEQARTKILSREVRAGEKSRRRMSVIAKDWLYRGCYRTVDDELASWDRVDSKAIREYLDRYPINQPTVTAYGPCASLE